METPAQPTPFLAPSIEELSPYFPSYEIEDFIAQGGMGAVYKARQISLDRPVAIKILPREFGQDPEFRDSFEAEAKAMARLNHLNLIGVHDFGEVDGMLFLVMEFVHGKSLYYSSHGKSIDPTQAAEIIIAVCDGLDHAHEADILHRDVKPANILLSPDATPKIGDFGLASPINETADADEVVFGTPGYTAPEVIQRLQVDRRADVFSTGVMLHELLTGALPDESRTPPSILSGCPVAFDAIVTRSTHPNPGLRYASAKELATDLKNALKTGPAPAAARLNLTPAGSASLPQASGVHQPPVKKPANLAFPLTLLAIVVIGGIIYITQQNKATPEPDTTAPEVVDIPAATPAKPEPVKVTPPSPAPVITTPEPKVTPRKELPMQALKRLKTKLANGDRDEFPEGTVKRNNSHFLLVSHPLSQQAAIRFVEEHGGHLAIAPSSADKQFLIKSFSPEKPAWVGAGIAAREEWQWMDESAWGEQDQLSNASPDDRSAVLSPNGSLVASEGNKNHAFIIQWRNDGSNPCTLDAQIKRAAESVTQHGVDKARYPVGTRTFEKSHFLITPKQLTWQNAHQFAKSHKAQLAVPSTPTENKWLTNIFARKSGSSSFWIGGYQLKPSTPWQWITREAWHPTGWSPGEPKNIPSNNRMMMKISSANQTQTWLTTEGKKGEADAVLLEWSKPKAVATQSFDVDKWLASVNRKIKDRVEPDVEPYIKDRENLIDKYIRSMKRAAKKVDFPGGRGGRGGGRNNYIVGLVEEAMEDVEESGELPESIPARAPQDFHDIHDASKASLEKLDAEYQAKLKAHLEFYTTGLLKKVTELGQTGYNQASSSLQETVDTIGTDTSKFLEVLGL